MALKEEKVFVTSGKKKANVRIKISAVSGMRVTIMHKKPEHAAATPSGPTVSRGRSVSKKREVSRAKVILVSFLDNRADTI